MAEKIIVVEPAGSSGKPGTGRAELVENSTPKNKDANGTAMVNAAKTSVARLFHSTWYFRQLKRATPSRPASPSHTSHPAMGMGFKYARLDNSVTRNCILNDYSAKLHCYSL